MNAIWTLASFCWIISESLSVLAYRLTLIVWIIHGWIFYTMNIDHWESHVFDVWIWQMSVDNTAHLHLHLYFLSNILSSISSNWHYFLFVHYQSWTDRHGRHSWSHMWGYFWNLHSSYLYIFYLFNEWQPKATTSTIQKKAPPLECIAMKLSIVCQRCLPW